MIGIIARLLRIVNKTGSLFRGLGTELSTIVELSHCILPAPLGESTTLCQLKKVHLLLYLR